MTIRQIALPVLLAQVPTVQQPRTGSASVEGTFVHLGTNEPIAGVEFGVNGYAVPSRGRYTRFSRYSATSCANSDRGKGRKRWKIRSPEFAVRSLQAGGAAD